MLITENTTFLYIEPIAKQNFANFSEVFIASIFMVEDLANKLTIKKQTFEHENGDGMFL
jgi:hypothetical protein